MNSNVCSIINSYYCVRIVPHTGEFDSNTKVYHRGRTYSIVDGARSYRSQAFSIHVHDDILYMLYENRIELRNFSNATMRKIYLSSKFKNNSYIFIKDGGIYICDGEIVYGVEDNGYVYSFWKANMVINSMLINIDHNTWTINGYCHTDVYKKMGDIKQVGNDVISINNKLFKLTK